MGIGDGGIGGGGGGVGGLSQKNENVECKRGHLKQFWTQIFFLLFIKKIELFIIFKTLFTNLIFFGSLKIRPLFTHPDPHFTASRAH